MSIARIVTQGNLSRPCITLWMPLLPLKRAGKGTVLPLPSMIAQPKMDILFRNRVSPRIFPGIQTMIIRQAQLSPVNNRYNYVWANFIRHELTPIARNYHVNSGPPPKVTKLYRRLLRSAQTTNRLKRRYSETLPSSRGLKLRKEVRKVSYSCRPIAPRNSFYKSSTSKQLPLHLTIESWKEAVDIVGINKTLNALHRNLLGALNVIKSSKTFQQLMTTVQEYRVKLTPFFNDIKSLKILYTYPEHISEFKQSSVAINAVKVYNQCCKILMIAYRDVVNHPIVIASMKALMRMSIEVMNYVILQYPHVKQAAINFLIKFCRDTQMLIRRKYPEMKTRLLEMKLDEKAKIFSEKCIHYGQELRGFMREKYVQSYAVFQSALIQLVDECIQFVSVAKTRVNKMNSEIQTVVENLAIKEQVVYFMSDQQSMKYSTSAAKYLTNRYPMLNPRLQGVRINILRTRQKLSADTKMLFVRMFAELKSRYFNVREVWYHHLQEYSRMYSTLKNLKIIRQWKDLGMSNRVNKYYSKLIALISSAKEKQWLIAVKDVAETPEVQPQVDGSTSVAIRPSRQSSNIYSQYSSMNMKKTNNSTMLKIGSREKVLNLSHRYVILNHHSRFCCEHIIFDLDRLKSFGDISGRDVAPVVHNDTTQTRVVGIGSEKYLDPLLPPMPAINFPEIFLPRSSGHNERSMWEAPGILMGMEKWINKVAVVTGANSGVGMAVTEKLLSNGMHVVAADERCENLQLLEERLRGVDWPCRLYPYHCDLGDDQEALQLLDTVTIQHGGVDVVVCNAGQPLSGNLLEGEPCDWRNVLDVNVISVAMCGKETVHSIQYRGQEGHIIFIGGAGRNVLLDRDVDLSRMSRGAVSALVEAFLQDLQAKNLPVRISRVCSNWLLTNFSVNRLDQQRIEDENSKTKVLHSFDVANAVLFTLSSPPLVQELDTDPASIEWSQQDEGDVADKQSGGGDESQLQGRDSSDGETVEQQKAHDGNRSTL